MIVRDNTNEAGTGAETLKKDTLDKTRNEHLSNSHFTTSKNHTVLAVIVQKNDDSEVCNCIDQHRRTLEEAGLRWDKQCESEGKTEATQQ